MFVVGLFCYIYSAFPIEIRRLNGSRQVVRFELNTQASSRNRACIKIGDVTGGMTLKPRIRDKGAVTLGNFSCNFSRNFVARLRDKLLATLPSVTLLRNAGKTKVLQRCEGHREK